MRRFLASALFVGILGTAGSTFADPVPVTSGFFNHTWDEQVFWQLSGEGFNLRGFGLTLASPIFRCGISCEVGRIISLDLLMTDDDLFGFPADADFAGNRYSDIFWRGRLEFESGTTVVAPGISDPISFTFTGALTAYANRERTGAPLFSTPQLTGAGTVQMRFFDTFPPGGSEIDSDHVLYTFADPVPEPATMLLLGSGLAALAARRRTPARSQVQRG